MQGPCQLSSDNSKYSYEQHFLAFVGFEHFRQSKAKGYRRRNVYVWCYDPFFFKRINKEAKNIILTENHVAFWNGTKNFFRNSEFERGYMVKLLFYFTIRGIKYTITHGNQPLFSILSNRLISFLCSHWEQF